MKSSNVSDSTFCDGCSQGRLAVVYMANGSNVYVGLFPAVGFLCLCSKGAPAQWQSTLNCQK